MTVMLGINAFHGDSSACLLKVGVLLAAAEEERFAGQVHQVEHHLAQLSSALHVSPFESAVVVSVDGFGDFASAAWGRRAAKMNP